MNEKINIRQLIKIVVVIAIAVIAVQNFSALANVFLSFINVITPLLIGGAMAFIVNIVMIKFERILFVRTQKKFLIKIRKGLSVILAYLIIIIVFGIILLLIIPELSNAVVAVTNSIPIIFENFKQWTMQYNNLFPSIIEYIQSIKIDWSNLMQTIINFAGSGINDVLGTTISVITVLTSGIINFIIAFVFSISVLFYKEKLIKHIHGVLNAYVSPVWRKRILLFGRTACQTFSSFITGQCIESVILGVLCFIGMMIFGFPYAPMISTLVGATCLIPYFGAYIGSILGAFIIFTVDPMLALWFLAFIMFLQQFEGNMIYPHVVGSSVGLPGLWVMAAVTIGGGLYGIIGMLIGVPIAAVIYKLVGADVQKRSAAYAEISPDNSARSESQEIPPETDNN